MFCTQPFNHIDVIVENEILQIQPCNVWSGHRFTGGDYDKYIKPIQTQLKENFANGCQICKVNETFNFNSRRISANQFSKSKNFNTEKIFSVGLRYGTLCNARCIICDHTRSTGWIKDAIQLGRHVEPQFAKCRRVDILSSIDDIEDRFEILRYPLKWNKIMHNLEWYKQQDYRIAVTPTISTLNVWYLEKFFKWLLANIGTDIYPQFVDLPLYLNIKHLNSDCKNLLKEQLSLAGNSLQSVTSKIDQDGEDYTREMLNYIKKLDTMRNTDFPTVFKEWYNVIQDSLHRKS